MEKFKALEENLNVFTKKIELFVCGKLLFIKLW